MENIEVHIAGRGYGLENLHVELLGLVQVQLLVQL